MINILRFLEYLWQNNWMFLNMLILDFLMSLTSNQFLFLSFHSLALPSAHDWLLKGPLTSHMSAWCHLMISTFGDCLMSDGCYIPSTLAAPFSHWSQTSSDKFTSCARKQWFSAKSDFVAIRHLTISGDTFDCNS